MTSHSHSTRAALLLGVPPSGPSAGVGQMRGRSSKMSKDGRHCKASCTYMGVYTLIRVQHLAQCCSQGSRRDVLHRPGSARVTDFVTSLASAVTCARPFGKLVMPQTCTPDLGGKDRGHAQLSLLRLLHFMAACWALVQCLCRAIARGNRNKLCTLCQQCLRRTSSCQARQMEIKTA